MPTPFANIPGPPQVQMPNQADYTVPNPGQYDTAGFQADMNKYKGWIDDPRSSSGFRDIMGLASDRTARAVDQGRAAAQQNAARRGFVGGYSNVGDTLAREGMKDVAGAGFDAANQIRQQAGSLYGTASTNYAGMLKSFNDAQQQRNASYFDALTRAREEQAQLESSYNDQQNQRYGIDTAASTARYGTDTAASTARYGIDTTAGEERARLAEEKRQYNTESQPLEEQEREFNLLHFGRSLVPPNAAFPGAFPGSVAPSFESPSFAAPSYAVQRANVGSAPIRQTLSFSPKQPVYGGGGLYTGAKSSASAFGRR